MKTLVPIWIASKYNAQMSLINNDCKMNVVYKKTGYFGAVYRFSTIGYSAIYFISKKKTVMSKTEETTMSSIGSDNWFRSEDHVSHIG